MAKIIAIVLAAGASRRHPGWPKLLREFGGVPLIARTLEMVARCGFEETRVVIRANDAEMRSAARAFGFAVIENENAGRGVGSSIACGVPEPGAAIGAAIFLGDMPLIRPQTVEKLRSNFESGAGRVIRPVYNGAPGHPVFIAAEYFGALARLSGDEGAAGIFKKSDVALIATRDAGVVRDFDVAEDFAD
ncbi:MAG: nucleotidyltransferase family protein [Parvularculaceae bacterium]|nr:nucleotidyltransferase family protein [Parvularculaceae bacterium]